MLKKLIAILSIILMASSASANDGQGGANFDPEKFNEKVEEKVNEKIEEEIKKRVKKKIVKELEKAAKKGSKTAKNILKHLPKAKKISNPVDIFLTVMEPTTVADGTLDPNFDYSIYSVGPPDTPPIPDRKPKR